MTRVYSRRNRPSRILSLGKCSHGIEVTVLNFIEGPVRESGRTRSDYRTQGSRGDVARVS